MGKTRLEIALARPSEVGQVKEMTTNTLNMWLLLLLQTGKDSRKIHLMIPRSWTWFELAGCL